MHSKTKHFFNSFVFMVVSAILLIVAFLGFTYAWFTDSKNIKITGNVPQVAVNVNTSNSLSGTNGIYTFASQLSVTPIATQPTISITSYSTIGVYIRARITCNWSNLDATQDSVFDVITFNLDNNWIATNNSNCSTTNDNANIQSGWLYYKSGAIKTVSPYYTIQLLTGITLNDDMPDDLKIQVYVEAVQANTLGLEKFNIPQSLTNW